MSQRKIQSARLPILLTALVASCLFFNQAAIGDEDFVRVQIRGTLKTGLMAIGGETTGTIISADGITWELDCTGNKEIMGALERLHGKTVYVQGKLEMKKGTEIRKRWIVHVEGLSTRNFFEKKTGDKKEDGKKTSIPFPIVIRDAQGGFAGFSGNQLTIEKGGVWKKQPFLNENLREATAKGKMKEEQFGKLAKILAEYKITQMPKELGAPVGANPRVISVQIGEYHCKMTLPPGARDASQLKGKRENEKQLLKAIDAIEALLK